jgi:hypothetical protein
MPVETAIQLLAFLGALIGVWVALNSRIVRLEVSIEHSDKQFDQIVAHLRRIEDKLDGKADRT